MAEPAVVTSAAVVEPAKVEVAVVEPKPTLIAPESAKVEPDQKTLISESAKVDLAKADDKAKAEPVAAFDAAKLKLPEGMDAKDLILGKFSEVIADAKMAPQDRAQALIDLHSEVVKKVGEANTQAWNDTKTEWETTIKADTEIGGDKLQPTLQQISKAIDTILPADVAKGFREGLAVTGAGSHPAVVKAMAKFASILTEGGHVPGGPGKGKMDLATTFFPNSPEMKGTG